MHVYFLLITAVTKSLHTIFSLFPNCIDYQTAAELFTYLTTSALHFVAHSVSHSVANL